jgi:hypothetical protein
MQADLFTMARPSDPATSKAAAAVVAPHLSELQELVLNYVREHRGTTDKEMVEALRKAHGGSESTYRTRRAELTEMGLIWQLGEADFGGRKHRTWTANAIR